MSVPSGWLNFRYILRFYSLHGNHIPYGSEYKISSHLFLMEGNYLLHSQTGTLYPTRTKVPMQIVANTYLWFPRYLDFLKWPIPLQPRVGHPPVSDGSINSAGPTTEKTKRKSKKENTTRSWTESCRFKCLEWE